MIDSAMTPEPIVATVRFERGDMSASIGAVAGAGRPVSRAIAPLGRDPTRSGFAVEGPQTDESRSPGGGGATGCLFSSWLWEEREEELTRIFVSPAELILKIEWTFGGAAAKILRTRPTSGPAASGPEEEEATGRGDFYLPEAGSP